MKTFLMLLTAVTTLIFSSCVETAAPAVGPTTGPHQSPHNSNSDATRTDLTVGR